MSNESELRRLRSEASKHRDDIAKASGIVATQRKKAADANAAASRSKTASTIKMKHSEAERATKAANEAESKRAKAEAKLAATEKKVSSALQKYEKDQQQAQRKAIDELRRRTAQAATQFDPSLQLSTGSVESERTLGSRIRSETVRPRKDVFLSHASEDKDDIARPLMDALEGRGVSVWFDELQIKVGQSIRQEIESGIAQCRFGVVIVSPDFFRKQWTQAELDALFGKKLEARRDVLLPVWHRVSKDEVMRQSPFLGGILALNSSLQTVEEIAQSIADVVMATDS